MQIRSCIDMSGSAFLLALTAIQVSFSTSVTVSPTPSIPIVTSPTTCPSGTINYITQSLPQQCLTSSWASKPVTHSAAGLDATSHIDALATLLAVNDVKSNSSNAWHTEPGLAHSPDHDTVPESEPASRQDQTSKPNAKPSEGADPIAESSHENDSDSPLDNANFLSFEEWKHQNLAKAGQSVEILGSKDGSRRIEHERRLAGINNALESLGEDSEIDVDFSGFGNAGSMDDALPLKSPLLRNVDTEAEDVASESTEDQSSPHRRSKDAGKTCKERSNYASFDCAATALKANLECKGATSILVESKDNYMLNVCSAKNKFFIVELCNDILIDTVVLANFEYFSSMFRTFRVSVSDRYPVKMDKWKELGTFEARNSREIQAFLVENPLIWARYLRIEFLTHYGAEYYCPVSLLRVHGTTMMEEFNHEVKGARGEDEVDSEPGENDNEGTVQTPDVVSADVLKISSQAVPERSQVIAPAIPISSVPSMGNAPSVTLEAMFMHDDPCDSTDADGFTPYEGSIGKRLKDLLSYNKDREGQCSYVCQRKEASIMSTSTPSMTSEHKSLSKTSETSYTKSDIMIAPQEPEPSLEQATIIAPSLHPSSSTLNAPLVNSDHTTRSMNVTSATFKGLPSRSIDMNSISSNVSSSRTSVKVNSTSLAPSSSGTSSTSATNTVRTSSTPSPAANPSTQESFFKSVHKRLQQLESNSTLSLQYIEEQSRILRDAFSKVEKRQLAKTSTFLETLNTTVLTELRVFRMQYDQIWQSTVLELSSQREQSAQEVSALSARMAFLADEVIFQKRMSMIQFMLIVLCLGVVIFSRYGNSSTYLELPPLVQNAINKSSANLARYTHFETPPASPSSTRSPSTGTLSKYGLIRRKNQDQSLFGESDVADRARSPNVEYFSLSPESHTLYGERNASSGVPSGDESDTLSFSYPGSSHNVPRTTKSSPGPATPSTAREEHRELLQGAPPLSQKSNAPEDEDNCLPAVM